MPVISCGRPQPQSGRTRKESGARRSCALVTAAIGFAESFKIYESSTARDKAIIRKTARVVANPDTTPEGYSIALQALAEHSTHETIALKELLLFMLVSALAIWFGQEAWRVWITHTYYPRYWGMPLLALGVGICTIVIMVDMCATLSLWVTERDCYYVMMAFASTLAMCRIILMLY